MAADSLVLANLFELLGGGVPSTLPICAGAVFRLGNQYDYGSPQPVVDFTQTLMGDGERPSGWRYSNRTFTIPIVVIVPSTGNTAADRLTLVGAREALMQAISVDEFTLVWSPDGTDNTRNTIFECWRAKAATVAWDVKADRQLLGAFQVTFDAMPFGRSDALSQITFDSPVAGQNPPLAQAVLDDYTYLADADTVGASLWQASTVTPYGTCSARWRHDLSDKLTRLVYGRHIYDPGYSTSFDGSVAGWFNRSNATLAATSAQFHSGTGSMSVTSVAAGAASVTYNTRVPVTPGMPYTLSAWVMAATAGRTVNLAVDWYNASGTLVSTSPLIAGADVTGSWTQVTGQVTPPAGAATGQIWMSVLGTAAAGEVHYVDDVSFTSGSPVDITGLNKLTFWLGMAADNAAAYRAWKRGLVHFSVVLHDSAGRQLTTGTQQVCNSASNPSWPTWNRVSMPIPVSTTFDYAHVTQYSITAWTDVHTLRSGNYEEFRHQGYLAGLIATPTAAPNRPATTRGGEYLLYGIEGTAPTALNLHMQLGFQILTPSTQTMMLPGQPGTTQSFTAPPENPNWLYGGGADGEDGTTGQWTGSDGNVTNGTVANTTAQAHTGTHSLSLTAVAAGAAMMGSVTGAAVASGGVPCQAGDRIAVRTWMRAGATARSVSVGAEFFSGSGTSLGAPVYLSAVTDSTSAWTQVNGRVTAPSGAVYARMVISVAGAAAGEVHYFDDLYLSWAVQATVIVGAAGGSGGSVKPSICAGGGGAAGELSWETQLDLTPGGLHSYHVPKGGQPNLTANNGGSGEDGFFTGLTATVTAHGGGGGQNRITSDRSGGSGGTPGAASTNTHHFAGGAGAAGNGNVGGYAEGGGGGGAASDGGAGSNGGLPAGGAPGAVGALNRKGGQGGAGMTTRGGNGAPGVFPGGGGGGASCISTYNHTGGPGANGYVMVIITTYTSKQNFPCCLVHKLSEASNIKVRSIINLGDGNDTPDGRDYNVDTADGVAARYDGTYSVCAVAAAWNGTAARTVTATIKQYEAGGTIVSSVSTSQSVTPANVVNGMTWLGEVTLPLKDMPAENTDAYYAVSITSANAADRFYDLLLIDTRGQVALINLPGSGYTDYWLDAPDLRRSVGMVLGSMNDRSSAVSVSANTWLAGGSMRLEPGDNLFIVYSPTGMPALEGDYWPRWWHERLY